MNIITLLKKNKKNAIFILSIFIATFLILNMPGCGGNGGILPPDNGTNNNTTDNGNTDSDNNNNTNNNGSGNNSGNNSGGSGNSTGSSNIEISKQVKVISSSGNTNISVTGSNTVELTGPDIPEIHPGNIIVSAKNGGVLLRVKKVTRQDGKLTLETSPASLTDVIRNGKVTINQSFKMTDGKIQEQSSAKSPTAKLAFENGALVFSGQKLDLGDKVSIEITDGSFRFDPSFDFVLDVDDCSVKEFKCSATGALEANLDADVELKAITDYFEKDVTLAKVTFPEPAGVIVIGGVPVVYDFFIKIKLGAGVSCGNIGTVSAGYDVSTSLTVGAQYTQHKWSPLHNFDFDLNPHLPEITIHPVSAEVYLKPEFGMRFYKIVGPSISYKDYFKLCGDYRYEHLGAELRKGTKVDLNFVFEIVDPITFEYTHNLLHKSTVLLARLAFEKEPENLGDITWSPTGINGTNFYWALQGENYKKVTVTGQPNSGYETGGFTIQRLCSGAREPAKKGSEIQEEINASKLITAHFVPEGQGNNWDGSNTRNEAGPIKINVEVFPAGAADVILFPSKTGYFHNEKILAQVKPHSGYVFHHWEGNAIQSRSYELIPKFKVPNYNCTLRVVLASDPPRVLKVPSEYATIQDAINAATYNDIIELAAGTYSGKGNRDLNFDDKNLTIRGQGCSNTIIDLGGSASNPHRLAILNVDSNEKGPNTIKLEKLKVINGYAGGSFPNSNGGVFAMSSKHLSGWAKMSLTISNCCFENCQAKSHGGVIWFDSVDDPGVSVNIKNTKFKNCTDAIYLYQVNRQPFQTTIDGCSFENNVIAIEVPYVVQPFTLTISNSTFTNNNGACNFGDADLGEGLTINKCTFTGNHSDKTNHPSAIRYYSDNANTYANITECTFKNNSAKSGGAVHISGKVNFVNCTFSGNSATESDGGAAYIKDGCIMQQCTFTSNQAHGHAGAVSIGANSAVVNSTLTGNSAESSGGAVELTNGGKIGDSTLKNNSADLWGGAIVITNYGGTVSNCIIQNNSAKGAGAIKADGGTIRTSKIENNKATNDYGGAIVANKAEIYSCTIKNNTAENDDAGAVWATDAILAGCEITGNKAPNGHGGAIAGRDSTLTDCIITGNSASEGGGIYCWGNISVFGGSLANNSPNDKAGCN